MFVLDFHVNDTRMPNGCKLAVPRLGVLSFYPSNLQCNGLRPLCVCLLPCGSAVNSLLLLSAPLSPLSLPLRHPVTPLSLSSQTVCHLIQLFFQADTLRSSQTQLMTPLCVTYATVCKVRAIKHRRCKRCCEIKIKIKTFSMHTQKVFFKRDETAQHSGPSARFIYFQVSAEKLWPLLSPSDSLYPWGDFCLGVLAFCLPATCSSGVGSGLHMTSNFSISAQPALLWVSMSRVFPG